MSAYVVDRLHIHQLVTAIDQYVAPTEEPTALGQALWNENIASVMYRYDDCTRDNLPGRIGETYDDYTYVTPKRTLSPVEVYSIACCYWYQSCEHEEWESSAACAWMNALMLAIENQLGKDEKQIKAMPEWDKAPWLITDDEPRVPEAPKEKKPVRHISLTDTAKLIRKALKDAWPTVKFSVRSKSYSGGCSIDVSWTDGPTGKEVDAVLGRFHGAQFDGMVDLKSSITQEVNGEEVHYGTDYVFSNRSVSPDFMCKIACKVAAQYKVAVPEVGGTEYGHVLSTPEANVIIENAPPFWRNERVLDVIHHVAHSTSAMPKPRIRVMPIIREVEA